MKAARISGIALSLVSMFIFAIALRAADNLAGTWKVNTAKSSYSPGPAPKSQTIKIEAIEGGMHEVTDRVSGDGKTVHYEFTAKYDGKDYAVKGDPDRDTVAVKKVDDFTYEVTSKKGGKVTITSHIVIARDGKSRTSTMTGTNAQGQKVSNKVVTEKQ